MVSLGRHMWWTWCNRPDIENRCCREIMAQKMYTILKYKININSLSPIMSSTCRLNGSSVALLNTASVCRCFLHCSQTPSKECEPYAYHDDKPVAPCGAIANSMFNGEPLVCSADVTRMIGSIFKWIISAARRHTGAVLQRSQRHKGPDSVDKHGHRLVDRQARQVQEPWRQQRKPHRGFPRWSRGQENVL